MKPNDVNHTIVATEDAGRVAAHQCVPQLPDDDKEAWEHDGFEWTCAWCAKRWVFHRGTGDHWAAAAADTGNALSSTTQGALKALGAILESAPQEVLQAALGGNYEGEGSRVSDPKEGDCPKCGAIKSLARHNSQWACYKCGFTKVVRDAGDEENEIVAARSGEKKRM